MEAVGTLSRYHFCKATKKDDSGPEGGYPVLTALPKSQATWKVPYCCSGAPASRNHTSNSLTDPL